MERKCDQKQSFVIRFVLPAAVCLIFILLPSKCAGIPQGQRINPEIKIKLDEFIVGTYFSASEISGLGLSIVQDDGKLLYARGYGFADYENGIGNQNYTQFLIGSVAKSFTALLLTKLLHENFPYLGESVLDTPIRKLLPQSNFTLVDKFRSEQATFRDLLSHRLCLSRDDLQIMADPFHTTEEILYRTRYLPEHCGIRGKFLYSNQMYVVAGELAGILANKPFEAVMQELLNKMGMTNTAFVQKTGKFPQPPFRALPHYVLGNKTLPMNPELVKRAKLYNAALGLYSTPVDMARYMRLHLNMGKLDERQIIPREVLSWISKPSMVLPTTSFKTSADDVIINEFGYGLGLRLSTYDGWSYLQHAGYFPPYSSLMSLYPGKKLGIFTTTNMGPVQVSMERLHRYIFELLNGSKNPLDKARRLKASKLEDGEVARNKMRRTFQVFYDKMTEKAISHIKAPPSIVGTYGSGNAGEVKVSEKFRKETNKTEYYLEYGRWYKGWLENVAGQVIFQLNYDTDIIQDNYADGKSGNLEFVAFDNDTMTIFTADEDEVSVFRGRFKRGVTLKSFPSIPWNVDSCEMGDVKPKSG